MSHKEKKEKKSFFREFKEFISRGNILDLAVGVIIGAAFNKIVTSLTNDIIMPLITLAMGKNSLADVSLVLRPEEVNEAGEVIAEALTWNYGNFLQSIIDFLIIALVLFTIVKTMMHMKKAGARVAEEVKEFADKLKDEEETEETEGTQEDAPDEK